MKTIRCSVSYHRMKVNDFPVFAIGVRDGIYGNAGTFTTPPLLQTDLQAMIDTYNNTRGAYEQGGMAQKGPYQAAKQALNGGLDTLSAYVDTVALGDENVILLSGFVPTKGNASETPFPTKVTGVKLKRGDTGELLAECDPMDYAVSYVAILTKDTPIPADVKIDDNGQLQIAIDNGDQPAYLPQIFIDFNQTRKKSFSSLQPGAFYYIVFFAINASGVGSFSDPTSIMCA